MNNGSSLLVHLFGGICKKPHYDLLGFYGNRSRPPTSVFGCAATIRNLTFSPYNQTGRWECFINVDDKTNCWHKIEQRRNQDIALLLESWVPLKEEIEKIDKREESYRMKGYEW